MDVKRSRLHLVVDGRPVTVEGEGLVPMAGQPDFVVFSAMMTAWDDGGPISAEDKRRILDQIQHEAAAQGIRIEVD
jgi:Immunity protein 74